MDAGRPSISVLDPGLDWFALLAALGLMVFFYLASQFSRGASETAD